MSYWRAGLPFRRAAPASLEQPVGQRPRNIDVLRPARLVAAIFQPTDCWREASRRPFGRRVVSARILGADRLWQRVELPAGTPGVPDSSSPHRHRSSWSPSRLAAGIAVARQGRIGPNVSTSSAICAGDSIRGSRCRSSRNEFRSLPSSFDGMDGGFEISVGHHRAVVGKKHTSMAARKGSNGLGDRVDPQGGNRNKGRAG